jgi:hypothetical protein
MGVAMSLQTNTLNQKIVYGLATVALLAGCTYMGLLFGEMFVDLGLTDERVLPGVGMAVLYFLTLHRRWFDDPV